MFTIKVIQAGVIVAGALIKALDKSGNEISSNGSPVASITDASGTAFIDDNVDAIDAFRAVIGSNASDPVAAVVDGVTTISIGATAASVQPSKSNTPLLDMFQMGGVASPAGIISPILMNPQITTTANGSPSKAINWKGFAVAIVVIGVIAFVIKKLL